MMDFSDSIVRLESLIDLITAVGYPPDGLQAAQRHLATGAVQVQ